MEATPEPEPPPADTPTRAIVSSQGVYMTVPDGWEVSSGEDWALARAPDQSAGFMFFGWHDASRSPEHLHRAEAEFHAMMPTAIGKVVTFASGLRMAMTIGDATRDDGVALKTLMMSGGAPSGEGGIGAFAFWRADMTSEGLGVLQAALDSAAPL